MAVSVGGEGVAGVWSVTMAVPGRDVSLRKWRLPMAVMVEVERRELSLSD